MEKKEDELQEKNIKQEKIHDILFNREIGWREIIQDLINTEQLDPWDINIIFLTDKYLEKVQELGENDFFISGKVLLAASLLLRIKSEFLLNKYIKSIDDILFGKKQEKYLVSDLKDDYFFSEEFKNSIPELVLKSPMPRLKKVTLQELMNSLNKAIITENRRIRKEINIKNAIRESSIAFPKKNFNIKDQINNFYESFLNYLKKEEKERATFNNFMFCEKCERPMSFLLLLHLENQKKIWLEQEKHFDEIFIWIKDIYLKKNPSYFLDLKKELEEQLNFSSKQKKRILDLQENFPEPLKNL